MGRVSNNFVATKESYVPPHQPGGGGWGIQQFTLGNLYVQNVYCMNYWTRSNAGYNLCRYLGAKFTLYRQQNVDWIFTYNLEEPLTITKYTYASYHPYKMLQFHKRIIIPSYDTAPQKKRKTVRKFIKPPKKLTNQWYFQNHLQNTPLINFFACACDLRNMFISKTAKNNNVTLDALNTKFFEHPNFQHTLTSTDGFHPDKAGAITIWGLQQAAEPVENSKAETLTLLANSLINDPGVEIGNTTMTQQYTKEKWGNVFYYPYLLGDDPTYILKKDSGQYTTSEAIQHILTNKSKTVKEVPNLARKFEPYIIPVRYNPNKDKGIGNIAYFKTTYDVSQKNWDPPADEELVIRNFPLWLMLWGFEDYMLKHNKITNLNMNGILVIRSPYLSSDLPAYVFLSDSFIHGQGPYHTNRDEVTLFTYEHWFPRWEFQKEAIESLLSTGPAVCRPSTSESIQAHLKYQFFFKWGGNPSTMEKVYDPNSQPVGPDPTQQLLNNEIISPTTSIENYIYNWETRRDTLTQAATERIVKIPINEQYVFTDGTTTSTDIQIPQTKKTETQEEEETQILQQLIQLQQHNLKLQQRFRNLKMLIQNS